MAKVNPILHGKEMCFNETCQRLFFKNMQKYIFIYSSKNAIIHIDFVDGKIEMKDNPRKKEKI